MLLGNGKTEQTCFTNRLQAEKIRLGSGASTNCNALGGDLLHLEEKGTEPFFRARRVPQ
jgi:hypothetical protein